jgi:hypothetical protein
MSTGNHTPPGLPRLPARSYAQAASTPPCVGTYMTTRRLILLHRVLTALSSAGSVSTSIHSPGHSMIVPPSVSSRTSVSQITAEPTEEQMPIVKEMPNTTEISAPAMSNPPVPATTPTSANVRAVVLSMGPDVQPPTMHEGNGNVDLTLDNSNDVNESNLLPEEDPSSCHHRRKKTPCKLLWIDLLCAILPKLALAPTTHTTRTQARTQLTTPEPVPPPPKKPVLRPLVLVTRRHTLDTVPEEHSNQSQQPQVQSASKYRGKKSLKG